MKSKFFPIVTLLVLLCLTLSSCAENPSQPVVVTVEGESQIETIVVTATPEIETEPITLYNVSGSDIPALDPGRAGDIISINWDENLFVQLTNNDNEAQAIVPEAATSWEISPDGTIYTFHLREDIPWVKHNPVTGETTQETDENGEPRFVSAKDFEYGILRVCDPALGSYYSSIIAPLIEGCEDYLYSEDPTPEMWQKIGVQAVDAATLEIRLAFPAGYFLSMTPMWTLSAVPQWAVEAHGDEWIEAGNIVTNGRFVLAEWVHNVRRIGLRNPLMPADMRGDGNVERIVVNVIPEESSAYAMWLNNEVEAAYIPTNEIEAHLAQFPDETIQVADMGVMYFGFRMTKEPFDDPHVRRAFSAAIDRQLFIDGVLLGQGLPMKHFAPPGIFGAPPIDEVGVGFDPVYARSQMEAAGYPGCEGFPRVSLMGFAGEWALNAIQFASAQWEQNLGCDPALFIIEQLPFAEMLAASSAETPDEDAPHMWMLAWGPDYMDENNWVGDVLWCQSGNRMLRECNPIDDLIVEARVEPDPERRVELYREIEEAFFGPEGEMPIAPIYVNIQFVAKHKWYDMDDALSGGGKWYNDTIDQEAQLAARE